MTDTLNDKSIAVSNKIRGLSPSDALALIAEEFRGTAILSTSFSWEDQAIAHMILSEKLPIKIFTLDTGRLFEETYYVWSRTNEKYETTIDAYYPDRTLLEAFVTEKGPNSFYQSLENRKGCCYIRKVEPLQRALIGNQIWITGLRAEHSADRNDLPQVEWDENNQILKYHPILHWSTEELKEFIYKNGIPYNTLHDKGFVSIGCAPCTRAIQPGEDFRAGRWWWENKESKECGLHTHA